MQSHCRKVHLLRYLSFRAGGVPPAPTHRLPWWITDTLSWLLRPALIGTVLRGEYPHMTNRHGTTGNCTSRHSFRDTSLLSLVLGLAGTLLLPARVLHAANTASSVFSICVLVENGLSLVGWNTEAHNSLRWVPWAHPVKQIEYSKESWSVTNVCCPYLPLGDGRPCRTGPRLSH